MQMLPLSFYQSKDVLSIAKSLIGCELVTNIKGKKTSGIILETEAYAGAFDKACHAHLMRRSKKCEVMFLDGGIAYVYLCYGMHYLFNVVTNKKNEPEAVLIRAVQPLIGREEMIKRRKNAHGKNLTNGPGKLCQAMGIDLSCNGKSLVKETIYLKPFCSFLPKYIEKTPRIGIDYAEEDAHLPYRFVVKKSVQKSFFKKGFFGG